MKAMILAAGRGKRMGTLTDNLPKPLLKLAGQELIVWQILRLRAAGIRDCIINVAYLGDKIIKKIGDGSAWSMNITYSYEESALETGGGIKKALPYFDSGPFLLINSDIYCELDLREFINLYAGESAFLTLVANPKWKEKGDFAINFTNKNKGLLIRGVNFTYAGIAILCPDLFSNIAEDYFPLAQVLNPEKNNLAAYYYSGCWDDLGTPERLIDMENYLKNNKL